MPDLPILFEVGSLVILTLILLADLLIVVKRPHVPSMKEATLWVCLYVGLALVFALLMLVFAGGEWAGQFLAGWLTEYSLSIDNLFVFVIIMARFAVPKKIQQEVLMIGIIIALVLRGIFILLGAQLIENFSWIFYIFGAWLVWTAVQQLRHDPADEEQKDSFVVRALRRRIRITDTYSGIRLHVTENGARHWTPMIIVLIAIGTTDLLFALDSIPAVFGVTEEAYIVFVANAFALLGLRALFFLVKGLLDRLVYLSTGLSIILAFIGVKLVLHWLHEDISSSVPEIGTPVSLGVILVVLVITTVASLIKIRKDPDTKAHAGSMRARAKEERPAGR